MMIGLILLGLFRSTLAGGVSGWTYRSGTSPTCTGVGKDLCGPDNWGHHFPMCANSPLNLQSPINFGNVVVDDSLPTPKLTAIGGGCSSWTQFANSFAYTVSFQMSNCYNLTVEYDGQIYFFAQMHFHSPSEHTIGGGYYAGETHMVHTTKTYPPQYLVLGYFLEAIDEPKFYSNNTALDMFWKAGGSTIRGISQSHSISEHGKRVNPYASFLPADQSHYVYKGSLTTPPCTGNIQWLFYPQPVTISSTDLNILRSAVGVYNNSAGSLLSQLGNNNRMPTQDLNGRVVKLSRGYTEVAATTGSTTIVVHDLQGHTALGLASVTFVFLLLFIIGGVYYFFKHYDVNRGGGKHEYESHPTSENTTVSPMQSIEVDSTA